MKIGFAHIFIAHIKTLKNNGSDNLSWEDICIFFLTPIIISFLTYFYEIPIDKESYNISATIYSIFAALLLNVQVAIFGILQKNGTSENTSVGVNRGSSKIKIELLSELNTNVSYLIVICCISVTMFLAFFLLNGGYKFESFVFVFLYAHFMLTRLMIIKRAYALFQKEYMNSIDGDR